MIGYLLDSARCLENRDYYRDLIPFLAVRGIDTLLWHFTDDQGCTLKFESVPGIASPNAYDKDEMRDLIAFAGSHGVQIIPELASLGHSRYITRLPAYRHLDEIEHVFTGMCPVAPETRRVLSDLLAESADVFTSPFMHVGLDEANIGHHPLTRQALQTRTRGELFADHINFMHAQVTRHGRTMMMWGDSLLHDRTIAPRIPRDIVICDWQYRAAVPADSVHYFLDEGFNVILCPAMISHDAPLFPGEAFSMPNLRCMLGHRRLTGNGRIIGTIHTVWQPERYMHDAMWIAFDLTAALLRDGPAVDSRSQIAGFAQSFYGFTADADWVDACLSIFELAPMRTDWLAIAKGTPAPEFSPDWPALAQRWTAITRVLDGERRSVRQHRQAYDVFVLLPAMLAHFYGKSARLNDGVPVPAEQWKLWQKIESAFVRETDAIWDRERFRDDPKKLHPVHEPFRDNHLLIVLRHSLAESTRQLEQAQATATGGFAPAGRMW